MTPAQVIVLVIPPPKFLVLHLFLFCRNIIFQRSSEPCLPLALCRQAWQADILALSPNRFEDAAEAFWGAGLVKARFHPPACSGLCSGLGVQAPGLRGEGTHHTGQGQTSTAPTISISK